VCVCVCVCVCVSASPMLTIKETVKLNVFPLSKTLNSNIFIKLNPDIYLRRNNPTGA